MERVSSGIDELDAVMGGLMPGDNVVWIGGDEELHHELQRQLLSPGSNAPARVFVTTDEDPASVRRRLGDVEILDARRGQAHADPATLERAVLERGVPGARVVIDNLDAFVRRLRARAGARRCSAGSVRSSSTLARSATGGPAHRPGRSLTGSAA